jgi:hypothetical protein
MPNADPEHDAHVWRWGCARCRVRIAGEPVARKAGTAGSGRGPLEKDLERTRHLASGPPVPHPIIVYAVAKIIARAAAAACS